MNKLSIHHQNKSVWIDDDELQTVTDPFSNAVNEYHIPCCWGDNRNLASSPSWTTNEAPRVPCRRKEKKVKTKKNNVRNDIESSCSTTTIVTDSDNSMRWKLVCPMHTNIVLAQRRPHDCGALLIHPLCPLCTKDGMVPPLGVPSVASRLSSDVVDHLRLLEVHYKLLLKKNKSKSPLVRRLISELQDLEQDFQESVSYVDTCDFEKRLTRALPVIETLAKESNHHSPPTLLEQLRSLGKDLNCYNSKLASLANKRCPSTYRSTLVEVTKDILTQFVRLDLTKRQEDIMACLNPSALFSEFEELQRCMTETSKALNHVSQGEGFTTHKSADKLKSKSKNTKKLRVHSCETLVAIPECISMENSSSCSENPSMIEMRRAEETHPIVQKRADMESDLSQHNWDLSTVLSSQSVESLDELDCVLLPEFDREGDDDIFDTTVVLNELLAPMSNF